MCDEGWQRLLQDASKFGANFHVSRDPEKIKSATVFASRTMPNPMRALLQALGARKEIRFTTALDLSKAFTECCYWYPRAGDFGWKLLRRGVGCQMLEASLRQLYEFYCLVA